MTVYQPPTANTSPTPLIIKMLPCDVERFGYEEIRLPLGDRLTVAYEGGAPAPKAPSKPQRRRNARKSGLQLTLHSLKTFGFTHPKDGLWLMLAAA